jgi:hypothetical protein
MGHTDTFAQVPHWKDPMNPLTTAEVAVLAFNQAIPDQHGYASGLLGQVCLPDNNALEFAYGQLVSQGLLEFEDDSITERSSGDGTHSLCRSLYRLTPAGNAFGR